MRELQDLEHKRRKHKEKEENHRVFKKILSKRISKILDERFADEVQEEFDDIVDVKVEESQSQPTIFLTPGEVLEDVPTDDLMEAKIKFEKEMNKKVREFVASPVIYSLIVDWENHEVIERMARANKID